MTEPVVLLNVDTRGVATITLNRPTVNNAYNGEVIEAMINAVGQCASRRQRENCRNKGKWQTLSSRS